MNRHDLTTRLRTVLASVVKANEAYADGDYSLLAGILESLEVDLFDLIDGIDWPNEGLTCGNCGLWFRWPGELDDHLRFRYWGTPWRKATPRKAA